MSQNDFSVVINIMLPNEPNLYWTQNVLLKLTQIIS